MGKNLQTLNGQNKLVLWSGRISECRSSGQMRMPLREITSTGEIEQSHRSG